MGYLVETSGRLLLPADRTVHVAGEDGTDWSYSYSAGAITQSGTNDWDGSIEPLGDPVEEEPPVDVPPRRGWFRRRS